MFLKFIEHGFLEVTILTQVKSGRSSVREGEEVGFLKSQVLTAAVLTRKCKFRCTDTHMPMSNIILLTRGVRSGKTDGGLQERTQRRGSESDHIDITLCIFSHQNYSKIS